MLVPQVKNPAFCAGFFVFHARDSSLGSRAPLSHAATDIDFGDRRVINQIEPLAACHGMGDHPVADFLGTIAGLGKLAFEAVCKDVFIGVLEQVDA